jgi:hypothetical protein
LGTLSSICPPKRVSDCGERRPGARCFPCAGCDTSAAGEMMIAGLAEPSEIFAISIRRALKTPRRHTSC